MTYSVVFHRAWSRCVSYLPVAAPLPIPLPGETRLPEAMVHPNGEEVVPHTTRPH